MKKIIFSIIFLLVSFFSFSLETEYKVIYSDNNFGKLDINSSSEEEMLKAGVAPSYVSKIISFRDIKGGIESIEELDRINGIGKKTCEKLEKYFFINENYKINPLEINKADETTLIYYGFSKKEVKAIIKYREEKGRIDGNIQLKKIISQKNYAKYKDLIIYDIF
ncbi:helix-hairpin-helix domain-containing protein [Fusobacterium perfoetens]|uniref:helix-hairpin-helix domain-containing protein n=1 Tax=Fusobacterium perfoetens TaxID=852 RepID=UPI00047F18CC|nr:helix-hairpin-helix domain-containing protein [Fusobacterium perfoetens]